MAKKIAVTFCFAALLVGCARPSSSTGRIDAGVRAAGTATPSAVASPPVVAGDRFFPSLQSSLTGTTVSPPAGALPAAEILSRVPADDVRGFGVSPTLTYGIFTDQNDVATRNSGVAPFGLIDRRVWVVMYSDVPASKAPPGIGPARNPSAPTTGTTSPDQALYLVMYVFDAETGKLLELVQTPAVPPAQS